MSKTTPDEEILFADRGVFVSRTRFVVPSQTFAMNAITSVRAAYFVVRGSRALALLTLILGAILLSVGAVRLAFVGSTTAALIDLVVFGVGVGLIVRGVFAWQMVVDTRMYFVKITTSSGEKKVCESEDASFITSVVEAVNQAIVSRG